MKLAILQCWADLINVEEWSLELKDGGHCLMCYLELLLTLSVRTRPYGSTITAQDVGAGCEWILWEGEYVPQFRYEAMLKTGKLKLFLLNRGPGYPILRDANEVPSQ